jgi:uncharacterized protein YciI
MKLRLTVALAMTLSVGFTFSSRADDPAKVNATFDEELARKLGADENGMKRYVLAILKTGPQDAIIKGDERKKLFAGHFANMGRLSDEGKLAVAGPFGENANGFRGLFILNAASIEEARELASSDPAIEAGIFVVDYVPWYGSASLMAAPEIHRKISKAPIK